MAWSFIKRHALSRTAGVNNPPIDAASEWMRLEQEYLVRHDLLKNAKDLGISTQAMESILKSQANQATPLWAVGTATTLAPTCQFTICLAGGKAGPDPARLLQERLRLDDAGIPATKLRNVHIFVGSDKTIAIAFKENSEHVVFEDETSMFPSDKLVAAFHLLLKAS